MFTERIYLMKAAGITAEYNPLHNGHVYHIEEWTISSLHDNMPNYTILVMKSY